MNLRKFLLVFLNVPATSKKSSVFIISIYFHKVEIKISDQNQPTDFACPLLNKNEILAQIAPKWMVQAAMRINSWQGLFRYLIKCSKLQLEHSLPTA